MSNKSLIVDDKLMKLKMKILKRLRKKSTIEDVLYAEKMEYLVEEIGHDQKHYLWYCDDKKEACLRIEDEQFLSNYDINRVFCGNMKCEYEI